MAVTELDQAHWQAVSGRSTSVAEIQREDEHCQDDNQEEAVLCDGHGTSNETSPTRLWKHLHHCTHASGQQIDSLAMKAKKCDATHPTRDVKCWSKDHGDDEPHWAAVVNTHGDLQKIEWRTREAIAAQTTK